MIPAEQVEQLIAQRIAEATKPLHELIAHLSEALGQAKRIIAMLQTKLYGVRAETSQVVLTAEGNGIALSTHFFTIFRA